MSLPISVHISTVHRTCFELCGIGKWYMLISRPLERKEDGRGEGWVVGVICVATCCIDLCRGAARPMLRLLVAIALVTAALSAPSWTNQLKAAQDQAAKTTELASSTSSTTTTASPTAAPSYSCNKYTHNLAQMYTCSNVPKCCRGYQAKGQASDMIQCMPDARNMNVTCPTAAPSSLAPSTAPPTSITEQCHCPDCFKNTTMDDLVTLNMLWVGESKVSLRRQPHPLLQMRAHTYAACLHVGLNNRVPCRTTLSPSASRSAS